MTWTFKTAELNLLMVFKVKYFSADGVEFCSYCAHKVRILPDYFLMP